MAQQFNIPPTNKRIETLLTDDTGRVIGKVVYEEEEQPQPDKSLRKITRSAYILLSDGRMISIPMLHGENALEIYQCSECIKPRLFRKTPHGLTSKKKTCFGCGGCVCPKHSRQSRVDHHWRCATCHRRHWWKCIFERILFKEG